MRSGGSKTHRKKQQKDRKIHIFDQNKRCIASLDVTQGIAEAELIVSSEKGLSVLFYVCDTEYIPKDTIAEWEKDEIPSAKACIITFGCSPSCSGRNVAAGDGTPGVWKRACEKGLHRNERRKTVF